jgi:hypothetical protein
MKTDVFELNKSGRGQAVIGRITPEKNKLGRGKRSMEGSHQRGSERAPLDELNPSDRYA